MSKKSFEENLMEYKKISTGNLPLVEENFEQKLTSKSCSRDTSTRDKFLKSFGLENLNPTNCEQFLAILKKYDVGHIVELEHGGTNDSKNLVIQSKTENREPGLKRQIERINSSMLIVDKIVYIKNELKFDSRLSIRAPQEWTIEQKIFHRNGRPYKCERYKMSNRPYLEIATCKAARSSFVGADMLCNGTEAVGCFSLAATIKASTSSEKGKRRLKEAFQTGVKVASPFVAKGIIKVGLDVVQTSKKVPLGVKELIAEINVSTSFNAVLNNSASIAANIILAKEIKSGKNL